MTIITNHNQRKTVKGGSFGVISAELFKKLITFPPQLK